MLFKKAITLDTSLLCIIINQSDTDSDTTKLLFSGHFWESHCDTLGDRKMEISRQGSHCVH